MVYDEWYVLVSCEFSYYEIGGNLGKGVREWNEMVFVIWNFISKMGFIF